MKIISGTMCQPKSYSIANSVSQNTVGSYDSQERERHFRMNKMSTAKRKYSLHEKYLHQALVDKTKIYLPLLYIKLRLIKQFAKVIN